LKKNETNGTNERFYEDIRLISALDIKKKEKGETPEKRRKKKRTFHVSMVMISQEKSRDNDVIEIKG